MSSEWIGRTLSKVKIEKLISRGGMAEVYLGRHTTLERPVAVKILHAHLTEIETLHVRFKDEAQAVAALSHPNIVQVFDFDVADDRPYIVMELIDGVTLDEYLQERIFRPLRMEDTHFFPPKEKLDRLAVVYERTKTGELERVSEEPIVDGSFVYSVDHPSSGRRRYYSGGGGLCSTALDYMRFCQMLLNGGELDGARVLSRKTVELMTTNQIGDLTIGNAQKFGLGFFILSDPSRTNTNASLS